MKTQKRPSNNLLCILLTVSLTVCVFFPGVSHAQDGKSGFFLGSWKELPLGARGAGMGNAYVSLGEGGFGFLSNPGGAPNMTETHVTTSYRAMSLDRKLSLASVVFPLQEQATLGLNWTYVDYGAVATRDVSGNLTGSEIGQHEHQFGLVFGKKFSKRVSIGVSVAYYVWKLDVIAANSVLFDVGAIFYVDHFLYDRETIGENPLTDIQVGLTIRSLGSSFNINTSEYWDVNGGGGGQVPQAEFPLIGVLGVSGRLMETKLLLAADLEGHEVLGLRARFGTEYQLANQFKLRAGLNSGALTAGAGFEFNLGSAPLTIDYAFQADRADERADHLFTLDLAF